MLEEVWGWRPRCVIVASTGGGGDAGSAYYLARALEAAGARAVLAVLPWERYVRDPVPGPIGLGELVGVEACCPHAARALGGCAALRGGRLLEPAGCAVASIPGAPPVYLLDGYGGAVGLERGLESIAGLHGCEAAVAFDVGGDVLASGCEEGLWSPLADALGLAAVASAFPGEGVAAVHSPGADGELGAEEVLERAAAVAARGGYRWIRGLSRRDVEALEEALSRVYTEAGRLALEAVRGAAGEAVIRRGTRRIRLSLVQALTLFLDAAVTASLSAARLVAGTSSILEARRRLNKAGVYTELDLEEDISLYAAVHGELPGPLEVARIRLEGRRRLAPCKAEPPI